MTATAPPVYDSARGDLTIALTGEAMISRALMPFAEKRYLGIRDLLHAADAAFTNGEMLFHNYEGAPTHRSATWMRCDPRFITDLQWLGINLMALANNHSIDYGDGGLLATIDYLDHAGMVHAGSGRNLADAMAPAYLDTAHGRIALVSATSSGRHHSRAGQQRPDMQGRPGVNLVRWMREWVVDAEAYDALRRVAAQIGWSQRVPADWWRAYPFDPDGPDNAVYFADRSMFPSSDDPLARFVQGDGFGQRSRLHTTDLERNVRTVVEARRMADWVIYSIHNHEYDGVVTEPARHIRDLAYAVIDAGADVVVGHGPHQDRGIEVYRGRPILYSLGNFIAQNNTVERLPQDALDIFGLGLEDSAADLYDRRDRRAATDGGSHSGQGAFGRSAIAIVSFTGGRLSALRLHPIELGYEAPRGQAGRPMLAGSAAAEAVLHRFRTLSAAFHVDIEVYGDVGSVRL